MIEGAVFKEVPDHGKCTKQSVLTARKNVKYHSSLAETDLFFVEIAS